VAMVWRETVQYSSKRNGTIDIKSIQTSGNESLTISKFMILIAGVIEFIP
jgi:hypothetical protein